MANSRPKVRAAIYARVSTPGQAKEGISLEVQVARLKRFCRDRGWRLVVVYKDAGKSGGSINGRLELKRLLADAMGDRFDAVVFYDQSRWARDTRDFLALRDRFHQLGIRLVDHTNPDAQDDDNAELFGTMRAAMDTAERKRSRWKMLDAFAEKATAGDLNFGQRRMYGLRWTPTGKLEHDPEEVRVWGLMRKLRLAGWSCGRIARLLNGEGGADEADVIHDLAAAGIKLPVLKPYSKNGWHEGTVAAMFQDEKRVTGVLRVSLPDPTDRKMRHGHEVRFPPLMTRQELDAFRKQAEWNRTRNPRPIGTGAMLSGLCVCGRCGAPMNVTGYKHKDRAYAYYGCRRRVRRPKPGEERCTLPYVPQRLLERHVVQAIMTVLGDDEKFEGAVAAARGGADKHAALANLQTKEGLIVKRLADLKRQHNQLLDVITASGLSPKLSRKAGGTKLHEVVTDTDRAEAELEAVRREQAALEKVVAQSEKVCDSRRGWFRRMKRWGKLTKAERSAMLHSVVAPQEGGRIVVDAWKGYAEPDDPPGTGGKGLDIQVSINGQLPIAGGSINEMAVLGGALAVPCTCNPLQQG